MYGFHSAWQGPSIIGGWFGWLSVLSSVIFWVAIILAAVFLVRGFKGALDIRSHESALDILEKRYAKGEIDKTEFEAKKKDLGHHKD